MKKDAIDKNDFLSLKDCPKTASKEVREAWAGILEVAPRRLTHADGLTVLNAARVLVEIRDAERLVTERGRDVESSGRVMQAPWVIRLNSSLRDWLRYSKALGLDPSAREGKPAMQEKYSHDDLLAEFGL